MAKHRSSHGGHMPHTSDRRALIITGWLTGMYFLVELGIGWWTGSIAVLSDAFHTFSAVGGVLIALAAGQFAQREATPLQTFGLIRAEILGALFNGLFLVVMAGMVMYMGAMRLQHPVHLPTGPMLIAALGGLATEALSVGLLYRRQKGSLNIKGAFWHILQTLVGSVIIIVSALVIRFTGFLRIDPILGMAFGLVLLWASWGIIRDSLSILLQRTPKDLDLNAAVQTIGELDGVEDVHHVHAWSLTPGKDIFSAHVCVSAPDRMGDLQRAIHDILKDKFGIYFSTVQLEEQCFDVNAAGEIDITRGGSH